MKKVLKVYLAAFLFLEISSLVSYFIPNNYWSNAFVPLGIGVGFFVVSLIITAIAKQSENKILWLSIMAINGAGLGLLLESWYLFRGFDNPLWMMSLVSFAAASVIPVFCIVIKAPFIRNIYEGFFVFFLAACTVGYICLVIYTNTTFVSTLGWYLIMSTGFLFAISTEYDDDSFIFRRMAISTFSIVSVLIIVVIILTIIGSFIAIFNPDCWDETDPIDSAFFLTEILQLISEYAIIYPYYYEGYDTKYKFRSAKSKGLKGEYGDILDGVQDQFEEEK